jgi:hypothetical protein
MRSSNLAIRIQSLLEPLRDLSPKREVVMLCLILAETMILWILAGTALAEYDVPYTPLPIAIIFGLLIVAYLVPHFLATIRIWTPEYEIVMGTTLIVSLLLVIKVGAFPDHTILSLDWLQQTVNALILRETEAIRSVWMLIIVTAYAWWRGRSRAEASLETAYAMLRFGLIWLAAILIFTVLVAPEQSAIFNHIDMALLGFMIFTLLAITIARQPEDQRSAAWNQGWIWVIILVAPVVAIALTSISTVGVFDRDTLDLLLLAVTPVLWFLQVIVQALVLTIALLAFIVISPVLWLLDRYGINPLSRFPEINLSPGNFSEAEQYASSTFNIENPIRYLIVGVILLALIWVLIRFSFTRRKRWHEPVRYQTDSLIDDDSDDSAIQRAVRWIAARLNRQWDDLHSSDPKWRANRRVRRAYQSFLRIATRRGFDRVSHDTPNQFAQKLSGNCNRLKQPTERITAIYNQARYSGQVVDNAHADDAESALREAREHFDKSRKPTK